MTSERCVSIYVGCCGFPMARSRYYRTFKTVEIQQTFYNLPTANTAMRWREEAPSDFIFNMKAWQVITHPPGSPTWRRLRSEPPGNKKNYGLLKPTEENFSAWRRSLDIARILRARLIVLQTPPSFGYSDEHVNWVNIFFSRAVIEANQLGVLVGWEPRGSWRDALETVKEIVCKHGVIHIVDPLRLDPVICEKQTVLYFRLHGLGGKEVNYRYKYRDNDLVLLANKLSNYLETHKDLEEVYVMFNNIYMLDDGIRFRQIASEHLSNKYPWIKIY